MHPSATWHTTNTLLVAAGSRHRGTPAGSWVQASRKSAAPLRPKHAAELGRAADLVKNGACVEAVARAARSHSPVLPSAGRLTSSHRFRLNEPNKCRPPDGRRAPLWSSAPTLPSKRTKRTSQSTSPKQLSRPHRRPAASRRWSRRSRCGSRKPTAKSTRSDPSASMPRRAASSRTLPFPSPTGALQQPQ